MNIKDKVKKITPNFLLERKQWLRLKRESFDQLKRFYNAITNDGNKNVNHCIAKVTFYSHQIEKGLSHSNFPLWIWKVSFNESFLSLKRFEAM